MARLQEVEGDAKLETLDTARVIGTRSFDWGALPFDRFSGGASGGGKSNEAFAPPPPAVLPELPPEIIVAPRTPAPAPPTFDPLPALGRYVTPIVGLLWPGNTGPDRTGELLEPLPGDIARPIPLPEVQVIATRPPRTPIGGLPPLPFDPFEPPNWGDLIGRFPTPTPFPPRWPIFDPDARPGPKPIRRVDPRIDPDPALDPIFEPQPARPASPEPSPRAPELVPTPIPGIRTQPIGDPFPPPASRPSTRPSPRPTTHSDPDPLKQPFGDPFSNPLGDPLWETAPRPGAPGLPRPSPRSPFLPLPSMPVTDAPGAPSLDAFADPKAEPKKADPCKCKPCSSGEKKKKKKKRKPRSVCYKGTYVELRNGLSKTRIEKVPCR